MSRSSHYFTWLFVAVLFSCVDNEALRGRITLTLTDAPIDADHIKEVNISITRIEVLMEGSQAWQAIKSFEDPITIDMLQYTQGEYYDLTEQYLTPGQYKGLRLQLNLANVDNGLTVFPQSNLVYTNGTQETLFVEDGGSNYVEVMREFEIVTNQTTFLTLDFDVRKSIVLVNDEYKLRPSMRVVDTQAAGGIDGQFRDFADYTKVAVYAYENGGFNSGEAQGEQPFINSISSSRVDNSRGGSFTISFLPAGTYDLVYVQLMADGSVDTVLGTLADVEVVALDDTYTCAQISEPNVQGNCQQIQPVQ